jgi:hypothetical protein
MLRGSGIAQSVLQLAVGWTVGVPFPIGTKKFSVPQRSDRLWGSRSLPFKGYGGLKRPERKADLLCPSSAEASKGANMASLLYTSSWRGTELIKHE